MFELKTAEAIAEWAFRGSDLPNVAEYRGYVVRRINALVDAAREADRLEYEKLNHGWTAHQAAQINYEEGQQYAEHLKAEIERLKEEAAMNLSLACEVALGITHSSACSAETPCMRCRAERAEARERVAYAAGVAEGRRLEREERRDMERMREGE